MSFLKKCGVMCMQKMKTFNPNRMDHLNFLLPTHNGVVKSHGEVFDANVSLVNSCTETSSARTNSANQRTISIKTPIHVLNKEILKNTVFNL